MRAYYTEQITEETYAMLRLDSGDAYLPGAKMILRFYTPPQHRGQGYTRKIAEEMTADADREMVPLIFNFIPDDPAEREWQHEYYKSWGFEDTDIPCDEGIIMLRPPGAPRTKK